MGALYLALLHHPVYDKDGRVVTTSITNMDIHDISRSARTYGVTRFFVATPVRTLRALAAKIVDHWQHGYGSTYNGTRKEALALVALAADLEGVLSEIEREEGKEVVVVATSARAGDGRVPFSEMKRMLRADPRPFLFLLGTGWGLASEVLARAHMILEPIEGVGPYNHLSVRSAAAVLLDRLCTKG